MKLKEIWNWIRKYFGKARPEIRPIDIDDPYATIKHRTKKLGFRRIVGHNNRRRTKGRNIQYVQVGRYSKPIYHGAL